VTHTPYEICVEPSRIAAPRCVCGWGVAFFCARVTHTGCGNTQSVYVPYSRYVPLWELGCRISYSRYVPLWEPCADVPYSRYVPDGDECEVWGFDARISGRNGMDDLVEVYE
jgi:hypothetical protein